MTKLNKEKAHHLKQVQLGLKKGPEKEIKKAAKHAKSQDAINQILELTVKALHASIGKTIVQNKEAILKVTQSAFLGKNPNPMIGESLDKALAKMHTAHNHMKKAGIEAKKEANQTQQVSPRRKGV